MKTLLKVLSASITLLGLASCSFNGDTTADQTKNYLDDRSRILAVYSPIVGTYEGEISAYVRSSVDETKFELKKIKLQLAVYTQDIQGGHDSNGQSTPLPTLVVRYRQLDIVRPDEIMDARYVQESGQIYATNSTTNGGTPSGSGSAGNGSTGGGTNTSTSICTSGGTVVTTLNNTVIKDGTITGTIQRGNGELGKFTATRTTNTTIAPATDPVTDCNDRLGAEYKTIAGVYKGTLTETAENGGATSDVRLNLSYIPVAASNGSVASTLVGSFQYGYANVPSMAAVFRGETTPAQLVMSYITSGTSGGGFSMTGTLEGDTYTAEAYSGNVGHLGTVVVKKVSAQ